MNRLDEPFKQEINFEMKYKRINNFLIFIFVLTLILVFSSATIPSFNSLIGDNSNFGTQQIFGTQMLLVVIMLFINRINFKKFVYTSFMNAVIISLSIIGIKMGVSFTQSLIEIFLTLGFSMCTIFYFEKKIAYNLIIFWGVLESIVGIIQHFFNVTIFNVTSTSTEIYHSIFFSHGNSASDISKLGGVANLRAFGTMDSGLTLGVFCLFCISVVLISAYTKNKKRILIAFFCIAIYSTITRNIYIATVLFFVFFLNKKTLFEHKQIVNIFYIIFLILMAFAPFLQRLISVLNYLAQNFSIHTFGGRYSFLNIGISEIPNARALFLGSNIITNEFVPLDNSFIADMLRRGLLFAVVENAILYMCFYWCLKHVSIKDFSLVLFMSLYPVIGFSNSVTYSFLVLFSLISIFLNNKKSKDSELLS